MIFREEAASALTGFLMQTLSLYPGRIEIWGFWFLWREKIRRTWRKTLGAKREPTTNLTHIW